MNELTPYTPSDDRPWNRTAVSHLLRRAGFSPSESEVQEALADGPAAAVDRLVNPPAESSRFHEVDALGESLSIRNDISSLRGWWLLRLRHTVAPLKARMAVFWHLPTPGVP